MQKDTDGEVTALDISNRGLAELPAFLCDGSLPRLRRLKVSGNALTELSPALLAGGSLSELIAGANQVWLLPDELGLCSKLEILGLGSNRLPALPASIGRCAALRTLRLSDNLLTELPGEIGSCTSLTDLFLAGNQLLSLPVALSRCPLVSLNVSANALTELPEGLCAGVGASLKTLQLSDNRLASLPADVGELRLLETLNLNGNRLRELPSSFGRLGAVVTVGLGANRLTALPHSIGGLRSLRTIQLGENRLATLPESIGACSGLEDLGLAQNLLQCLPRSVSSLTRLRSLVLAQAKCAALPCEVGKLTALLQLELSGSKLEALPAEICELAALLSLRASDCRLVTLPEQLGSLSALQTLRVDGNRLARLPPTVGRLQWLKELWAGGNALASLPPSVGLLSQLRVLGLSSNQIETLPTELCACARLERLLVDDNRLRRLPDELEQLEACRELGLSANQLSEPPATLPPRLESLRLNSNLIGRLPVWPRTPAELWLHDNPCWGGRVAPANALPAGRDAGEGRPLVAVLLPGLVRSYAHGEHWRSLFARYADAYELRAFMHVWPICGSVANNFNQETDRAAGQILDLDKLRAAYPDGSVIELADIALWMHVDGEGFDGRFYNQWAMLARCHELMLRSLGGIRPDFVIRGRPDLRAACIPRPLESCGAGGTYLAMQDYLWGSDAFFYGALFPGFIPQLWHAHQLAAYACGCAMRASGGWGLLHRHGMILHPHWRPGDAETMASMCNLVSRYEEYTRALGYASSEPMMERYIADCRHKVVHFSRCFCIDRN